ncbi:hypothetical protein [Tomitella fengzijianii]|uniref:Translation initiation factor n=1 Tax=Tomitella fengzijianii TaxID=2597660 RepID=A0A516X647_9ACTN|nr:hypothetical protein [Tomitella fengzijianii]QDQ98545.1 hypothetical protein FO059_15985 [Tomitella fengzijianii]
MATRSAAAAVSLTDDDLATIRSALADGKNPTVYLRDPVPSLEVPAGASAKVQSINGTTLTVKPRRIDDELPYEADELRMTRKAPAVPAKKVPSAPSAARKAPARKVPAKRTPTAPAKAASPARTAAPEPDSGGTVSGSGKAAAAQSASGAADAPGATAAQRRKPRGRGPTSVTVTIEGAASGTPHEWTVTVVGGGARSGKPVPVRAESVVQSVDALGVPAASKAVDAVLVSARAQAERRVEELARELAEAKKTLRSLGK